MGAFGALNSLMKIDVCFWSTENPLKSSKILDFLAESFEVYRSEP